MRPLSGGADASFAVPRINSAVIGLLSWPRSAYLAPDRAVTFGLSLAATAVQSVGSLSHPDRDKGEQCLWVASPLRQATPIAIDAVHDPHVCGAFVHMQDVPYHDPLGNDRAGADRGGR